MARQAPQPSEVQPCRSASETKSQRKAKLKAVAQDLMDRFAALDSEQIPDVSAKRDADGTSSTPRSRSTEKRSSGASESTSACQEGQDEVEEVTVDKPYMVEEPCRATTSSGPLGSGRRRHIVIIGHSYIHWAERYAATSSWGSDLGLGAHAHITWKGLCDMQWNQLCRLAAFGQFPPDVLVVHLGGDDLPKLTGKALILDIIRNLKWLNAKYPTMRIVWSTIIPRLAWEGARNICNVNTARRRVNREVCRFVCSGLGSVIGHQRIQMNKSEFFRKDGVHLSDLGLDVFLEDIKGGLLVELKQLGDSHGT
ncbi:uncharacterized protein LOC110076555 [Pogona vitticeps]